MTDTLDVTGLPDGFRAIVQQDPDPDTSYLHQEGWGDHLRAYDRGDWDFVGVVLERRCRSCGQWETLGSLWGIEHSRDMASLDYLADVARELLSDHTAAQAPA